MKIRKKPLGLTLILIFVLAFGTTLVRANDQEPGVECNYQLDTSSGQPGTAFVTAKIDEIKVIFSDAKPNTLYTVWVDHKNRATGQLAGDYPAGALPRGVAPAFALTDGVTAGFGLDKNGIITDESGNADLVVKLDYNLLAPGASPVVDEELDMQGLNRVGGHWMRVYNVDENTQASVQVIDPQTGFPIVGRSTAQGITIVGHFDNVTHGHTPGVGGVDHFSAFKGDFPAGCLP